MSERTRRILSGLITLTLFAGLVVFGVRWANGALRPRYRLTATFAAAGQGLQSGSDVKVHGVNVGRVKRVRLVRGRALVEMDIDGGEDIPVASKATIRPKTLFGEKFVDVDPGAAETTGPFLSDHGVLRDTVGGFELERVLGQLYPILRAVRPEELAVVLDTLAQGGAGEGQAISDSLAQFAQVARVQVAHDADTRQFLSDLAALSDELADRAGDVVGVARDLNQVLPTLNERGDELAAVLDGASRLAGDVADVLEHNRGFLEKSVTEGGKSLQVLADRRGQIPPLVTGLRQFVQVLAEVTRVPFGDGTTLAAVKLVFGEDSPCGRVPSCTTAPAGSAATAGPPQAAPVARTLLPVLPPLPVAIPGVDAVTALVRGLR